VPLITLEKIAKVPVGMFVGLQDVLANPTDCGIIKGKLRTLDFYREYDQMDHYSFQIGKDMGFVQDVISLIKKYEKK
jgi:hypothetical protein